MTVKLRASGWEIAGRRIPWVWGQVNYWNLERSRWRDVLRTYRQAGHEVVSASVLPRVHQIAPGQYDFGQIRPQNDLPAFISEAGELGLKVILEVGPRDIPGVAAAGYPEELLTDEKALARNAQGCFIASGTCFGGEIFTLPSLVSRVLLETLKPFALALSRSLAAVIHPDGPVIGIGLTQAPGWGPGLAVFAADYHDDSIALYRSWLEKSYKQIKRLNEGYKTNFTSFQEIDPPRSQTETGVYPDTRLLDWARFREEYFIQAAEDLHDLFSGIGLDRIPVYLVTIPTVDRPNNLLELERCRCFAYAMPELPLYATEPKNESEILSDLAYQNSFLACFQARIGLPEDNNPDAEFRMLSNIASGMRAWNALAPAGAGQWPGFLSDRQGVPRHSHHLIWETLQNLVPGEGFMESRVYGDIVLLTIPGLERSKYIQTPPTHRWDLLGGAASKAQGEKIELDTETEAYRNLSEQLEGLLRHNHYPYLRSPGDVGLDRLRRSHFILVPGAHHTGGQFQSLVVQLREAGVNILVVGPLPDHPVAGEHTSWRELAKMKIKKPSVTEKKTGGKSGGFYYLPDFSEAKIMRLLKQMGIPRPLTLDNPGIRLNFYKFRNRIFIAAANHGPDNIETTARREGKFVLKDFWNNNKFLGGKDEVKVFVPGRGVKFWELIPC